MALKNWSSNTKAANVLNLFNQKQQVWPRIKAKQLELLSTIVKLVQNSTAADERRRTECLCNVTTLDDLHKDLKELGFHLNRSTLYIRLFPRRENKSKGKRHVNMVPVKFLRPGNGLWKKWR